MNYSDMQILEGLVQVDEMEQALAMQRAINGGAGWRMQGSYGRSMMEALQSGAAMLGRNPAHDAYGSLIPSRSQVKPGSFGSYEFVAEKLGDAYAKQLSEV